MESEEIVRVLRVVEIVGPRSNVERQVGMSIHGERHYQGVTIRAATVGIYPEVLSAPDGAVKERH